MPRSPPRWLHLREWRPGHLRARLFTIGGRVVILTVEVKHMMNISTDCNATTHDYCETPATCQCGCHETPRTPSGHEPGGFATVEAWRQAQRVRKVAR